MKANDGTAFYEIVLNFSQYPSKTQVTQDFNSFSRFVNNDLSFSYLPCRMINTNAFDLKKGEKIVNFERIPKSHFPIYNFNFS